MRVLLTTDTVGGVWTFSQELTRGLLDRGHAVALVSLGRLPSPDQQSWADATRLAAGSRFNYTGLDCPLEWMPTNDSSMEAAPSVLRLADDFNADLVHSSQFCFGTLAADVPTLVTAHSDVLSWAAASRGRALEPSPWLTRYTHLVQRGLTAANAVAAPTAWMLEALAANFTLPTSQTVLPNGRTLKTGADGSRAESVLPRKLQAVTAGRLWDAAKNLALLTELTSPMPLIVAGELPPNPPAGLRLTGQLPEESLLELFAESALYLCLSRYEPFGLAPLEAALCGCGLLVHDIPSLREVWQDAALYFNSADTLAALLRALAQDPARRTELQRRSHQHALQYTRDRMTEAYLALYEQLVEVPAHAA